MSVGSVSSGSVATAYAAAQPPAEQPAGAGPQARTVADHVAAADDGAPIRSLSTTRGTLVDTYL
jgi:hypothetical protein